MKLLKYLIAGVVGLVVLLVAWGLIEPYLLDIDEQRAEIPGLPPVWEGRRIGLIADWQIGMWMDNTDTVEESISRLIALRPALVLIAGDFVYGESHAEKEDIAKAKIFVRPLTEAGIPVYAVLGNHDYRMNKPHEEPNFEAAELLRQALESVGVHVLQNEAVALAHPGNGKPETEPADSEVLYLTGVGARWPDQDHPQKALAQLPAQSARITMMHNPNTFPEFPPDSAPFAVAGHTHGGQIRIPFTESWSWMAIVKKDEVHVDGWIHEFGKPGNHLYVNRGIGFSRIPIRINCPPEITLFTLSGGQRENK